MDALSYSPRAFGNLLIKRYKDYAKKEVPSLLLDYTVGRVAYYTGLGWELRDLIFEFKSLGLKLWGEFLFSDIMTEQEISDLIEAIRENNTAFPILIQSLLFLIHNKSLKIFSEQDLSVLDLANMNISSLLEILPETQKKVKPILVNDYLTELYQRGTLLRYLGYEKKVMELIEYAQVFYPSLQSFSIKGLFLNLQALILMYQQNYDFSIESFRICGWLGTKVNDERLINISFYNMNQILTNKEDQYYVFLLNKIMKMPISPFVKLNPSNIIVLHFIVAKSYLLQYNFMQVNHELNIILDYLTKMSYIYPLRLINLIEFILVIEEPEYLERLRNLFTENKLTTFPRVVFIELLDALISFLKKDLYESYVIMKHVFDLLLPLKIDKLTEFVTQYYLIVLTTLLTVKDFEDQTVVLNEFRFIHDQLQDTGVHKLKLELIPKLKSILQKNTYSLSDLLQLNTLAYNSMHLLSSLNLTIHELKAPRILYLVVLREDDVIVVETLNDVSSALLITTTLLKFTHKEIRTKVKESFIVNGSGFDIVVEFIPSTTKYKLVAFCTNPDERTFELLKSTAHSITEDLLQPKNVKYLKAILEELVK